MIHETPSCAPPPSPPAAAANPVANAASQVVAVVVDIVVADKPGRPDQDPVSSPPPRENRESSSAAPKPHECALDTFGSPVASIKNPMSVMHKWPLLQWGRCVISFKHAPSAKPVPLVFHPYPKGSALECEHAERCARVEAKMLAAVKSRTPQPEDYPLDDQPSIFNLINAMNYDKISDEFEPWIQRKCKGKKMPSLTIEQLAVPSVVIEVPAEMQDEFDALTLKINCIFADVLQQDLTPEERRTATENLYELAQRVYLIELFPEMTWVVYQINKFHRKAAQYAFATAVDITRRRVIDRDPGSERLACAAAMTLALSVRLSTTMAEEAKNNNAERRRQTTMDLGTPRRAAKRSAPRDKPEQREEGDHGEEEEEQEEEVESPKRAKITPTWQQIPCSGDQGRSLTWRQLRTQTDHYVSRLKWKLRPRRHHRRRGKRHQHPSPPSPAQQTKPAVTTASTGTQATDTQWNEVAAPAPGKQTTSACTQTTVRKASSPAADKTSASTPVVTSQAVVLDTGSAFTPVVARASQPAAAPQAETTVLMRALTQAAAATSEATKASQTPFSSQAANLISSSQAAKASQASETTKASRVSSSQAAQASQAPFSSQAASQAAAFPHAAASQAPFSSRASGKTSAFLQAAVEPKSAAAVAAEQAAVLAASREVLLAKKSEPGLQGVIVKIERMTPPPPLLEATTRSERHHRRSPVLVVVSSAESSPSVVSVTSPAAPEHCRGSPVPAAVPGEEDDEIVCGQLIVPTPEQSTSGFLQPEAVEEARDLEGVALEGDVERGDEELDEEEEELEDEEEEEEIEYVQYAQGVEYEEYELAEGEERPDRADSPLEPREPESSDYDPDDVNDEDFQLGSSSSGSSTEDARENGGSRSKRPAAATAAAAQHRATSNRKDVRRRARRSQSDTVAMQGLAAIMSEAWRHAYAGELRDLIAHPKECCLDSFSPPVPIPSHRTMVALLVFAASTMSCSNADDEDGELYNYIFSYAVKRNVTSKKTAMTHLRAWFDAVFGQGGQCYEYLDPAYEHPLVQLNHRVPSLLVANQYPGDHWRYEYVLRSRADIGFALAHVLLVPFFTSNSCMNALRVGPPGSRGIESHWIPGVSRVLNRGLRMWLNTKKGVETVYNLARVCLDARAYHSCYRGPGVVSSGADQQQQQQQPPPHHPQRRGPLVSLSRCASFYYDLHPNENASWKERFAAAGFGSANDKIGARLLSSALFVPTCAEVSVVPSQDRLLGLQRATASVFFSALDYYATTPGEAGDRCCFVFWGNGPEVRALYESCQVLFRYQTIPENSQTFCWAETTTRISRRFKMTLVDLGAATSAAGGGSSRRSLGGGGGGVVNGAIDSAAEKERRRKRKGGAACSVAELAGVSVDSDGVMHFAQFTPSHMRGKMHLVFYVAQTIEVGGARICMEPKLSRSSAAEPLFVFRVLGACPDRQSIDGNYTDVICPRSLANAVNGCSVSGYRKGLPIGLRCISVLSRMGSDSGNDGGQGALSAMHWLASICSRAHVTEAEEKAQSKKRKFKNKEERRRKKSKKAGGGGPAAKKSKKDSASAEKNNGAVAKKKKKVRK